MLGYLGENEKISLKFLTFKLVMLLALVLGSDLVRLVLEGHTYSAGRVYIPCKGLALGQGKRIHYSCFSFEF